MKKTGINRFGPGEFVRDKKNSAFKALSFLIRFPENEPMSNGSNHQRENAGADAIVPAHQGDGTRRGGVEKDTGSQENLPFLHNGNNFSRSMCTEDGTDHHGIVSAPGKEHIISNVSTGYELQTNFPEEKR